MCTLLGLKRAGLFCRTGFDADPSWRASATYSSLGIPGSRAGQGEYRGDSIAVVCAGCGALAKADLAFQVTRASFGCHRALG
jgi:hypothetical protein